MPVERIQCCAGQPHAYEVVVGGGAAALVQQVRRPLTRRATVP